MNTDLILPNGEQMERLINAVENVNNGGSEASIISYISYPGSESEITDFTEHIYSEEEISIRIKYKFIRYGDIVQFLIDRINLSIPETLMQLDKMFEIPITSLFFKPLFPLIDSFIMPDIGQGNTTLIQLMIGLNVTQQPADSITFAIMYINPNESSGATMRGVFNVTYPAKYKDNNDPPTEVVYTPVEIANQS